MVNYEIAGVTVEVSGPGLDHIAGFAPFRRDAVRCTPAAPPRLTVELGAGVDDWDATPLHTFDFRDVPTAVKCDFARDAETIVFGMTEEGGRRFLMRITEEEGIFRARTGMDATTPVHLLRFAVWMAYGVAALPQGVVAVHASTICAEGMAVMFLGESGTGKSTHTRLWLKNIPGTELLNDDSPMVNADGNGIRVYGSPWSGKTPCYKDRSAPLSAIVRLSQAPHNTIKRLPTIAALGAIQPSCPPSFGYDAALSDRVYAILSPLLKQTPVYHLECLPDAGAARLVFDTLKKDGLI